MADKFSDGTALGDGLPVLKRPPRSQARLGLVGVRNRPQDCSWWRLLSLVAQGRPQSGSWGSKRRTESVGGRCPTEPEHAGTLARLSGQLKSLTPKLVDDVDILNGPFGADHGDFPGLGVVLIRLKEKLTDRFTARF